MSVRRSRARRASSLAAAVALISAGGGLLAAPAFAGNGSNGTIKIGGDTLSNDPHVGCPFDVDFSGFDDAVDPAHTVTITLASPDGSWNKTEPASSFSGTSGTLTVVPDFGDGLGEHHVKVDVVVDGDGSTTKSKTVWVDGDCSTSGNTGDDEGNDQGQGDQGQADQGQGDQGQGTDQGTDQGTEQGNDQGTDQGTDQGNDHSGDGNGVEISSLKIVNAAPETVPENTDLTYTLTVTTGGDAAQNGVIVTDAVPSGTSYAGCQGGTTCSLANGTVRWDVAPMPSGGTAPVQFTVHVNALDRDADGDPQPRTLHNVGTVGSDKVSSTDSNSVDTEVTGLGKTPSPSGPGAGALPGSNGTGGSGNSSNGIGGSGTSSNGTAGSGTSSNGTAGNGTGSTPTDGHMTAGPVTAAIPGPTGSSDPTQGSTAGPTTTGPTTTGTNGSPNAGSTGRPPGAGAQGSDPTAAAGTGVPVSVLGLKVTRGRATPASLPFTGVPTLTLLGAGVVSLALGSWLMAIGTRRRTA